jgi:hypothetical protein
MMAKMDRVNIGWGTEVDGSSGKLADYGPAGAQMAVHFNIETTKLPKLVMDQLGLTKGWLDTEEARQVMFGEQYDYDIAAAEHSDDGSSDDGSSDDENY